tara:strand:+ start:3127 stop:3690 length:564 start_codon:yes stop_codon:yes gene_type:complete
VRLDEVKAYFGDQISITWKSFLLKPESKTPDREKFIRYTQGWKRMAVLEPKTSFVPWATSSNPPTGSLPAQVAQKIISAEGPEYADAMHHKLLEAYFKENLDISDWSVIANIANEVGFGKAKFSSLVDTQRLEISKRVIDEHNEAISQGITSVPTVLINQVLPVPGAQETETYVNWISRLIERQNQN